MGGRLLAVMMLFASVPVLGGCQPVHEPWVNNAKQWKEQHFKTNEPNTELRQRLETGQTDR